jgi:hypothetical protein
MYFVNLKTHYGMDFYLFNWISERHDFKLNREPGTLNLCSYVFNIFVAPAPHPVKEMAVKEDFWLVIE